MIASATKTITTTTRIVQSIPGAYSSDIRKLGRPRPYKPGGAGMGAAPTGLGRVRATSQERHAWRLVAEGTIPVPSQEVLCESSDHNGCIRRHQSPRSNPSLHRHLTAHEVTALSRLRSQREAQLTWLASKVVEYCGPTTWLCQDKLGMQRTHAETWVWSLPTSTAYRGWVRISGAPRRGLQGALNAARSRPRTTGRQPSGWCSASIPAPPTGCSTSAIGRAGTASS